MPASLEQRSSRPIVVVALATALCLTGDSMLYIALPIYWHEVGLEALWQVGVLLSVNRLIRLPFNPLIGWLYQRISLRAGLLLATTLGTLTTLGYGIAKGFIAWLLLRALWGIGWSFFRIGGLSAAATVPPASRAARRWACTTVSIDSAASSACCSAACWCRSTACRHWP